MQRRDPSDNVEADVAGQSARREFERRRKLRRERVASRGRVARVAAALTAEPQSTRAWDQGAKGEELVGARLDRLRECGVGILHDRKIAGRGNIDHLAVTTGGVWVIDTKRYSGRPALKIEGGLFRPQTGHLTVGGRDRDNLVLGVQHQVDHVRRALGHVPVTGALCFVTADWPLIGGSFATRGIQVLPPRQLIKTITRSPAGPVDVAATMHLLDRHFRPA
ncbi:nuclease-related domain-containing protein [Flexivirga alba]|uniref:Nuclease-related domain-containing protein n=1 Tax=Flexivirga alba TaxID=702742 RepID=A0ABW2AHA2_9MICO